MLPDCWMMSAPIIVYHVSGALNHFLFRALSDEEELELSTFAFHSPRLVVSGTGTSYIEQAVLELHILTKSA